MDIEGNVRRSNQSISDGFDICIWLGDFNYRIELKMKDVKRYLNSSNIREHIPFLLKHDQMKIERDKGTLFLNRFLEGDITFCPTYKMIVGTHDYVLEEGGDRIPGWTDRILFKCKNSNLQIKEYNSIMEIVSSDHKPVYAIFELDLSELRKKGNVEEIVLDK